MVRHTATTPDEALAQATAALLVPGAVTAAFQPIVRLSDGAVIGYEGLARFADLPPQEALARADLVGMRADLELACWAAVAAAGPPPGDRLLFVNASPRTLVDRRLEAMRGSLPERLVIELTEQDAVADYDLLRTRLQTWSNDGVRLAIDDTGAGYSSLQHVLQLSPEFLKLDRGLIHEVDADRTRRALVLSLVAFAREVGATVIAEGVERRAELEALRDAGVHLAQGNLLGEPGEPWPAPAWQPAQPEAVPAPAALASRLDRALASAPDVRAACEAVVGHLYRRGQVMPSAYIERDGLLRCMAQRGYWQILDGIPPGVGAMYRAVETGELLVIDDVGADGEFLEAAPGLRSEAAVPVRAKGRIVGALNIESHSELDVATIAELEHCADLLGRRLDRVGVHWSDSPLARLARTSKELAGLAREDEVRAAVVRMACEVSGMGSALLAVRHDDGTYAVAETVGPLSTAFRAMRSEDVGRLATMVEDVTSCYTAGDVTGRPVAGTERLRDAGVVEVAVLPLISLGRRTGILLVAHTSPMALSTDEIEPLELLAAEAGRCLDLAARVAELEWRATRDPLTGLENHSAFHEALVDRPGVTVAMADIDGFKGVNDTLGHLVGDRLLKELADALADALRGDDRVYRVGGDELAFLLRGLDEVGAAVIGQRLCAAARAVLARHGASLSIGIAIPREGEAPHDRLARADQALYEAKGAGRGRAVLSRTT